MLLSHASHIPSAAILLSAILIAATDLALALDRYRFRNGVMLGIGLTAAGCYRAVGCRLPGRWERAEVTAVAIATVMLAQLVRQLLR